MQEYHFHFFVRQFAGVKHSKDLIARFVLIISLNHFVRQHRRTRNILMRVVGVGRTKDRNIKPRLRPRHGVGAVRVRDTANVFPSFVKQRVRFCIRRRAHFSFHHFGIIVHDNDIFGFQKFVRHAAGLDGKNGFIAVYGAYVTKRKQHQSQLRQLHIGLVTFLL